MRPFLLSSMLGILWAAGCSVQDPEFAYVPDTSFREVLHIGVKSPDLDEIRMEEWVELQAFRETGLWKKVSFSEKDNHDCWWRRPPPPIEDNVQTNVGWLVKPAGEEYYIFNLPDINNIMRRAVYVKKSGRFTLQGESSGCKEPFYSDVIQIEVKP